MGRPAPPTLTSGGLTAAPEPETPLGSLEMPLIVPLLLIGFGVALLLYGTRLWLLGAGTGALLGLGLLRLLPGEQSGVLGLLVVLVLAGDRGGLLAWPKRSRRARRHGAGLSGRRC